VGAVLALVGFAFVSTMPQCGVTALSTASFAFRDAGNLSETGRTCSPVLLFASIAGVLRSPPIQTTPSCCLLACILFYIHALQELITNLTPPLRPNLSNSLLSPLELPPPQPPSSKILQHEHYSSTPRPQLQKHQPEPLEGSICRTWRDCSSIRATPPATSCLG